MNTGFKNIDHFSLLSAPIRHHALPPPTRLLRVNASQVLQPLEKSDSVQHTELRPHYLLYITYQT